MKVTVVETSSDEEEEGPTPAQALPGAGAKLSGAQAEAARPKLAEAQAGAAQPKLEEVQAKAAGPKQAPAARQKPTTATEVHPAAAAPTSGPAPAPTPPPTFEQEVLRLKDEGNAAFLSGQLVGPR